MSTLDDFYAELRTLGAPVDYGHNTPAAKALHLAHRLFAEAIRVGQPHPIDDGRVTIDGKTHMRDHRGALIPIEVIKPQHLLEDETVRKIVSYALPLSDQIARFLGHTEEDIDAFDAILEQEYGITPGRGEDWKGNRTLMTFDGLFKVQVQVQETIEFGPELQVAKNLVDECLAEWSADAMPQLRAVVTEAFNVNKKGEISRTRIYDLLRMQIDDARWERAMKAVRDAMRVTGSKSYTRAYMRERADGQWKPIPLDAAKLGG